MFLVLVGTLANPSKPGDYLGSHQLTPKDFQPAILETMLARYLQVWLVPKPQQKKSSCIGILLHFIRQKKFEVTPHVLKKNTHFSGHFEHCFQKISTLPSWAE